MHTTVPRTCRPGHSGRLAARVSSRGCTKVIAAPPSASASEPAKQDVLDSSLLDRAKAASFASCLALLAYVSVASDSQAADLEVGRTVFNNNCAACHMGGRNSVVPERTLDKAAIEAGLEGGFNVEAIIHQVENGKGAMPAWANRLDEDEIQAVAEYVYNTALNAAWE